MDKRIPLVALLCLAGLPAAAEWCSLQKSDGKNIVIRRLKGPSCSSENALVFTGAAGENRYGKDDTVRTFVTDKWPGFMGGNVKCRQALTMADKLVYSDDLYIVGKANMWAPQIWRISSGSCDGLGYKFSSAEAKLKSKGDDSPSLEAMLESMGAERLDVGDFAEALVEGKRLPKKD